MFISLRKRQKCIISRYNNTTLRQSVLVGDKLLLCFISVQILLRFLKKIDFFFRAQMFVCVCS